MTTIQRPAASSAAPLAGGFVVLDRRRDHAVLRINRPEQRNALSNEVLAGLRAGVAEVKADPAVRVLILAGTGDEAFCAGGNLRQMGDAGADAYEAHRGRSQLAALFRDLWELGKPTVARVPGYALAGGFGLAAACDFIVASERAVFGIPEISIGLWPYMISVPLLYAMAPKQALKLMMTGERIGAAEGVRLGFVTELAPHGDLDAVLEKFVARLAEASPQSMALGRMAFYTVLNHDVDARLRMLEALLTVNLSMPDAVEGLAAFVEKRTASWKKGA
ncbi:enoyl-CoA hydratase-related protein [Xanthobacter autotrophicus DSM 431]|uniref:enoyl-CoA hydratase/isomerase family protein n=1 Tax=Xanthobacter nonsaccharivorans TaxID=3119912 RepID=UPI00372A9125